MSKHGWTYKKLGEVCSNITDGSHNPPKGIEHSEYKMISSQNIFDDRIIINDENVRFLSKEDHERENKRTKVEKGVVLLTIVGTIGRSCVVKGNEGYLTLQRSVAALKPNDNLNSRFLMHSLIGNRERMNNEAHGIAQKGLYLKKLSALSIPVPPMAEQEAIVAELDEINEAIAAMQQQVADLDTLAQSTFYDMFGDPVTNPKGWDVKKLGVLCEIKGRIGFRGYTKNDFVYSPLEGAISLSPTNIVNGNMDYSKCSYVTWDKYFESPEIMINNGDLLLVKTGSSYGKCALVRNLPHEATINPQFVVIKEIKPNNIYLTFVLCSDYARCEYDRFVLGTAIPTFSQKSLSGLDIPVPPLSLQQEFAAKVEAIESAKAELNAQIAEMQTLLASRMDYYFD